MSLLPISLGVRRGSDAEGTASKGRVSLKKQIESVLSRDSFTCRCCGFASKRFQRVVSVEPHAAGRDDSGSLTTLCTFCEMCFDLERAGITGAGLLIWLPEISQTDLNHIARAIYVAKASNDALGAAAGRTLEVLTQRRLEAKKRLGTDDPLILATALLEAVDDAAYARRTEKLEGIRLLPLDRYLVTQRAGEGDVFPQMIAYWTSPEGPFARKPVSEWAAMFDQAMAKAEG